MNEQKRLIGLFEDLYNGDPWLDVSIAATLAQISAVQAFERVLPNCNTIGEITIHLIEWRKNVLQRVQGRIIKTPDHNYFERVIDTSDLAWIEIRRKFMLTQTEWISFLQHIRWEDMDKIYPPNQKTHFEHIHGIIQHDAYHLGQIVMLSKHLVRQSSQ